VRGDFDEVSVTALAYDITPITSIVVIINGDIVL